MNLAMVDAVFEIGHRTDASKVTDMHRARERKMSDVIGEYYVEV